MQTADEWTNELDLMQGQETAILGYCNILHSRGIPFGPESDPRDFGDSIGPCGAAGRTKKCRCLWFGWFGCVGMSHGTKPERKNTKHCCFHIS